MGYVAALVIVWVSAVVVGSLLGFFLLPGRVAIVLSSIRGDSRPWAAALLVAAMAFVGGACVSVGVRLTGFRIDYGLAAFAMGLGELLKIALAFVTISSTASDTTGVAAPGFGLLALPLGLVLGLLLPAYVIDAGTGRERPTGRPYEGVPFERQ